MGAPDILEYSTRAIHLLVTDISTKPLQVIVLVLAHTSRTMAADLSSFQHRRRYRLFPSFATNTPLVFEKQATKHTLPKERRKTALTYSILSVR